MKKSFANLSFIILQELGLFLACQLLGIVWLIFFIEKNQLMLSNAMQQSYSVIEFLFYFLIVSLMVWLLSMKTKRLGFLKFIFNFSVFLGVFLFFEGIFYFPFSLVFFIIILVLRLSWSSVWVHNLILVLALAGIAPSLGVFLTFPAAVLLFGLLAIYDFIAVFYTKHMVTMFKKMGNAKVFFAFIMPLKKQDLNNKINDVDFLGKYVFLGTGDVALPLIILVTAFQAGMNIFLVMVAGVMIGLIILIILFLKYRRPIPGLPPLAIGVLLGFLVTFII